MKTAIKIVSLLILISTGLINAQNNLQLSLSKDDEQISLQWSTAKETNSSYFLVESSQDGKNFSPAAQVKAAGYALNAKKYSYTPENTALYYRVSLVSMDGGHSAPVAIQLNAENPENGFLAKK